MIKNERFLSDQDEVDVSRMAFLGTDWIKNTEM